MSPIKVTRHILSGSPIYGFVVFDADEAGRKFPAFEAPPVAPTFMTAPFNPRTDFQVRADAAMRHQRSFSRKFVVVRVRERTE